MPHSGIGWLRKACSTDPPSTERQGGKFAWLQGFAQTAGQTLVADGLDMNQRERCRACLHQTG
jgi:hypothetical protein